MDVDKESAVFDVAFCAFLAAALDLVEESRFLEVRFPALPP
jgi:hypothetical protein